MERRNKMETMPMGKLVADMSLPMMLSLLIQSLYNIVDSIFVARLSEQALTATSLAYPVQMLMIAVGVGTAVGVNAALSRALGARQQEAASRIATTGVVLSVAAGVIFLLIGLLFSGTLAHAFTGDAAIAEQCAEYLFICMVFSLGNMVSMMYQRLMQATGKTFLSMLILVAGAVTNIVLDPILIFGLLGLPALGIRGAAIATVIGQWVSMLVGFVLQARCNPDVKLSLRHFRLDPADLGRIYHVGLPTIITQALQSMMVTCFNAILQPFSTTAVAFFGVYYKLQTFLFMPMNGLGQAAIPIVGYSYGARNRDRIRQALRVVYPTAAVIALVGMVVFLLIPGPLLSLFSAGEAMLALGIPAVRLMAVTFLPAAVTLVTGYIASGLQDGMTNMLSAVLRQFLPLIPCAWLLATLGGIGAVWFAFWISEACALIYALLRLRKLLKARVEPME